MRPTQPSDLRNIYENRRHSSLNVHGSPDSIHGLQNKNSHHKVKELEHCRVKPAPGSWNGREQEADRVLSSRNAGMLHAALTAFNARHPSKQPPSKPGLAKSLKEAPKAFQQIRQLRILPEDMEKGVCYPSLLTRWFGFLFFLNCIFYLFCGHMRVLVYHGVPTEVKEQPLGVSSFLLPC